MLRGFIRDVFSLGIPAAMALLLFHPLFDTHPQFYSQDKTNIRVGFEQSLFSEVDLKDAQLALEIWMDNLTSNSDKNFEAESLTYPDLDSMVRAVRAGDLDIINISGVDFLSIPPDIPIDPFLVPAKRGSPLDNYLLIVHKSSGITQLRQLENRTLTLKSGGQEKVSRLWMENLLLSKGLGSGSHFFHSIQVADKPSQVLLPVFFKQVDAGIIPKEAFRIMVELNPQIGESLSVLEESPGLLNLISCFHRELDPEIREIILDTAYVLHELRDGQQILTLFQMDQALPFDPSYIRELRELVATLKARQEGVSDGK